MLRKYSKCQGKITAKCQCHTILGSEFPLDRAYFDKRNTEICYNLPNISFGISSENLADFSKSICQKFYVRRCPQSFSIKLQPYEISSAGGQKDITLRTVAPLDV